MRQHNAISLDLYGMPGHGPTRTAAKAHAISQLEAAMDGTYAPTVLRFPLGHIGIVSRCTPYHHAHAWEYQILWPDLARNKPACTVGTYDTPALAERALRQQVAQCLVFQVADNGLSVLEDAGDRADHARYIAWRERYRQLLAAGYSDTDAHTHAFSASDTAAALSTAERSA